MSEHEPLDRALTLLTSIVSGKTPLTWKPHDDWVFWTNEVFTTPDRAIITVFFDCGEADYVDSISLPDAEGSNYDGLYPVNSNCEPTAGNLTLLFPDPSVLFEPFYLAIEAHGHKRPYPCPEPPSTPSASP